MRGSRLLVLAILSMVGCLIFVVSPVRGREVCLQAAVNHAAGSGPFSVFAADLDSDNDADLTVANWGSDNVSILLNCTCHCPCLGDPVCDSIPNVQDVVTTVNVAFRGYAPTFDPSCLSGNPAERTDLNCDGVSSVIDVVRMVDVAFRGDDPAARICNPCQCEPYPTNCPSLRR